MLPGRADPATLPAAGLALRRDTLNEDYRYINSRDSTSPQKRQATQWFAPPTGAHPHIEFTPAEPPTKPPPRRPDLFHVDDLPCARPSDNPGLTVIHPSYDSPYGTRYNGSPASPRRTTNTLEPTYQWPVSGVAPSVFPVAAAGQEPGEWRLKSPPRTSSLDVSDIPGTSPQRASRTRKDAYSAFDYSDLPRSSPGQCSPIRALQRDGRAPLDNSRLGHWTQCGDTGKFTKAHRTPTNPTNPQYNMGNRIIADDPNVGHSKQLIPKNVDRRTWQHEGQEGELLARSQALAVGQNQNQRSPQRRYQRAGGLLLYKDQLKPGELMSPR